MKWVQVKPVRSKDEAIAWVKKDVDNRYWMPKGNMFRLMKRKT